MGLRAFSDFGRGEGGGTQDDSVVFHWEEKEGFWEVCAEIWSLILNMLSLDVMYR